MPCRDQTSAYRQGLKTRNGLTQIYNHNTKYKLCKRCTKQRPWGRSYRNNPKLRRSQTTRQPMMLAHMALLTILRPIPTLTLHPVLSRKRR